MLALGECALARCRDPQLEQGIGKFKRRHVPPKSPKQQSSAAPQASRAKACCRRETIQYVQFKSSSSASRTEQHPRHVHRSGPRLRSAGRRAQGGCTFTHRRCSPGHPPPPRRHVRCFARDESGTRFPSRVRSSTCVCSRLSAADCNASCRPCRCCTRYVCGGPGCIGGAPTAAL